MLWQQRAQHGTRNKYIVSKLILQEKLFSHESITRIRFYYIIYLYFYKINAYNSLMEKNFIRFCVNHYGQHNGIKVQILNKAIENSFLRNIIIVTINSLTSAFTQNLNQNKALNINI